MESAAIVKQIKAYVEGTLSLEQQQSFEANLASKPEWKNAYESYLATQATLDKMAMSALRESLNETIKEQAKTPKISPFRTWYRMAAAILLLILAGTFLFNQFSSTNQQLADNAYVNPLTIFPEMSATRNTEATTIKWTQTLADFQKKAYQKVIASIESQPNLHPTAPLLLAHAYYKNNQLEKVYPILDNYQASNEAYQDAADWLRVLTLIKEQKIKEAQLALTNIIQKAPASIFRKKAIELSEKLAK